MITVLVAAYNGEAYIREQMDSILAQSQGGIHIVVSDDCSSDRTPEILEEYCARYPGRVTAIRREKPSGGAAAHFLGLLSELARAEVMPGVEAAGREPAAAEEFTACGYSGSVKDQLPVAAAGADYFMLSDQDDVWLPQKAEKLLMCMQELEAGLKPGTPALVHSDLAVVDENLRVVAHSFFKYQKISPERTALPQLLVQNNVTGGAVMINRPMLELLKDLPQVCLMHDAWLALLASCYGAIGQGKRGQSAGDAGPPAGRQRGQGELPEDVRPCPVPAGAVCGPSERRAEGTSGRVCGNPPHGAGRTHPDDPEIRVYEKHLAPDPGADAYDRGLRRGKAASSVFAGI